MRRHGEYARLKARNPDFIPSENALHYWGHDVLDAGRDQQAIAIFKLDVALHGAEPWPYISLGQAYEKVGDVASAKRNYQLALDKMPGNEVAAAALKSLMPR